MSILVRSSPSSSHATEIQALRDFAELAGDWFWEQDAELRFTSFFGVSTEMLHRKQSEFLGKRRWDMPIHGITQEQLEQHIATCERREPFRNFVYEVVGDGGEPQYYSVSGTPVFNASGEFVGYHGIGRNVTEMRLAEAAIKESEGKLSQIVYGNPVATFVIDSDHRITHWNRACAKLTGRSASQMLGGTALWQAFYPAPRPLLADLIVSGASDVVIADHYKDVARSTLIEGAFESEDHFQHLGDDGLWLHLTAAPIQDSDGIVIGAIETLQDITAERNAQLALKQLAHRDGLTGVANRRFFDQALHNEWKRALRESQKLSLLMLDVDHFKRFNDSYGHQAGDLCLQRVAKAIRDVVQRPGDVLARYGGEEFAVILTDTDAEGAVSVAGRLLKHICAMAYPHSSGEGGIVTLSIGVATTVPQHGTQETTLIGIADNALYRAKQAGRNCYFAGQEESNALADVLVPSKTTFPVSISEIERLNGNLNTSAQEIALKAVHVRAMLENSPIGISIVTPDGKTRLFTNQKHRQNFGYANAEAARIDSHTKTWVKVSDFEWAMSEFTRTGKLDQFEHERCRTDG